MPVAPSSTGKDSPHKNVIEAAATATATVVEERVEIPMGARWHVKISNGPGEKLIVPFGGKMTSPLNDRAATHF
jgi:hypothetical protein